MARIGMTRKLSIERGVFYRNLEKALKKVSQIFCVVRNLENIRLKE